MNTALLREHIKSYLTKLQKEKTKHDEDIKERERRKAFFAGEQTNYGDDSPMPRRCGRLFARTAPYVTVEFIDLRCSPA
jgi:hypothetical protein